MMQQPVQLCSTTPELLPLNNSAPTADRMSIKILKKQLLTQATKLSFRTQIFLGFLLVAVVPIIILSFANQITSNQLMFWGLVAVTTLSSFTLAVKMADLYSPAIATLHQISSSRETISTLEAQITELTQAQAKAEAADKAKTSFLANFSHELRSPLNAIIGFARLLERDPHFSLEQRENVNIISRSAEHLLALINNILDLAKIEAGKTVLHLNNFDLYRLLKDLEDMFHLRAETQRLDLHFLNSEDVPRYIYADEIKLRQVLINLIHNAVKFTSQGRVIVTVKLSDRQNSKITFSIEDTGVGIAPEEQDRLFQAFSQTKSGENLKQGTGLGLAISRNFIQLMGGEIHFRSEVGKGTTFFFEIPVDIVEAKDLTKVHDRPGVAFAPDVNEYLGVSYIYQEFFSDRLHSSLTPVTTQDLEILPKKWRSRLHQATLEGDITLIESLIEEIQPQDEAIARTLLDLAARYQFEQLLSLTAVSHESSTIAAVSRKHLSS
ncbi:MAG: ATP-binding protein [Oscillatoria sp. PMC 1068.18]|nr:ATP-binding protein [Oscillatoria sp. PMC 1076.18]MEC4991066.1 ATP-binding protein [Oscillatoria sp. PMC 1068.18]